MYKRLDHGTFGLPQAPSDGQRSLLWTERELDDLLDGIDVEAPAPRKRQSRLH